MLGGQTAAFSALSNKEKGSATAVALKQPGQQRQTDENIFDSV